MKFVLTDSDSSGSESYYSTRTHRSFSSAVTLEETTSNSDISCLSAATEHHYYLSRENLSYDVSKSSHSCDIEISDKFLNRFNKNPFPSKTMASNEDKIALASEGHPTIKEKKKKKARTLPFIGKRSSKYKTEDFNLMPPPEKAPSPSDLMRSLSQTSSGSSSSSSEGSSSQKSQPFKEPSKTLPKTKSKKADKRSKNPFERTFGSLRFKKGNKGDPQDGQQTSSGKANSPKDLKSLARPKLTSQETQEDTLDMRDSTQAPETPQYDKSPNSQGNSETSKFEDKESVEKSRDSSSTEKSEFFTAQENIPDSNSELLMESQGISETPNTATTFGEDEISQDVILDKEDSAKSDIPSDTKASVPSEDRDGLKKPSLRSFLSMEYDRIEKYSNKNVPSIAQELAEVPSQVQECEAETKPTTLVDFDEFDGNVTTAAATKSEKTEGSRSPEEDEVVSSDSPIEDRTPKVLTPERYAPFGERKLSVVNSASSSSSPVLDPKGYDAPSRAPYGLQRSSSDESNSQVNERSSKFFKNSDNQEYSLSGPPLDKREHLYKILVIGELGTGKTSIIKRYVHQFFSQHYRATIGVDFALKVLNWDENTVIRLQLWDIAGQERFGNMTRVYYKEAVGAFIVFDVTRAQTFDAIAKWKNDLDTKVTLQDGSPVPTVLLANKCDQPKEGIACNPARMDDFCRERNFAGWFETSAEENINIDEAARFLVSKILRTEREGLLFLENHDTEKFSIDSRQKEEKDKCAC